MPLLYGEGLKAYTRLQEEIIRREQRLESLCLERKFIDQTNRGILASTPSEFRDSGSIRVTNELISARFPHDEQGPASSSWTSTLDQKVISNGAELCIPDGRGGDQKIGIWLKRMGGVYSRVQFDELRYQPGELQRSTSLNGILVSKRIVRASRPPDRSHRMRSSLERDLMNTESVFMTKCPFWQ